MRLALEISNESAGRAAPEAVTQPLVGATREEIVEILGAQGIDAREAHMRAKQLWNWIYVNGVTDFERMTNISKPLRQAFADRFTIERPEVVTEQVSSDGTRKWLFRFRDAENPRQPPVEVETVYIPEEDRGTLCVSSQVGCTLTCSFCHTGTQRLVRNLTAAEILSQILMARERLGDFPGGTRPTDGLVPTIENRAITNVVMMGMGEPPYNYENGKEGVAERLGWRRHCPVEAPDHSFHLGRGALHRANRARDRRDAGDFTARGAR